VSFFFFFLFFGQLHKQAVLKYKYALCSSPFKRESNRNGGTRRAWRGRRGASLPLCADTAALAGSSAPGSGVRTHLRASGGRYVGGKGTAGVLGSAVGGGSCPSCGARCRDGDGCSRVLWMPRGSSHVPRWGLALLIRDLFRFQLPTSTGGTHFEPGMF